jgi:hypothetical protein
MFEAQYQTSRLREDLLQAAFGQQTGCDNTHLFAFLRNMSLSRDKDAPIDLNPGDWLQFHQRKDVTKLQDAIHTIQTSKDQATIDHTHENENNNDKKKELGTLTELLRLLRSRLRALRHAWGKLKLADIRQQYFKKADRARVLGKEPPRIERIVSNIPAGTRALKSNSQTADQIFQHFVRKWNISKDDEDPGRYIDLLIAYSRGCSKAELDLWEDEYEIQEEYNEGNEDEDDDDNDYDHDECDDHERIEGNDSENIAYKEMEENWKCVICDLNFSSRKTLTSHFQRHKRAQYFNIKKPRRCPACRKDKTNKKNCLVESGLLAWFNHLERFHGPYSLPYTPSDLKDPARYPCPFSVCTSKGKDKLFNARGLNVHITKAHKAEMDEKTKDRFKTKVRCHQCCSCKRCNLQGVGHTALVESVAKWKTHFDIFHADEKRIVYQCFICQDTIRTAQGLKSHFSNLHERREGYFAKSFSCPECIRTGNVDPPIIIGRKAWQEHIGQCHDGAAKEHKPEELVESPDTISHYPCLVCGRCYHGRSYLQEHLKLSHEGLIKKTSLQFPQCIREFNNTNAWIHHTIREHKVCESMRRCTVGSHNNATVMITRPTDETATTDEINLGEIAVLQQDQLDGGARSFEEFRKQPKRKRNLLGDTLLSDENELIPNQRLRYTISESNTGSYHGQDDIPIDPDLMKWSTSVTMEYM